MGFRGTTVRGSVEVEVPAHVAYERLCRIEEYPRYRAAVRRVTAVSETAHRWELAGGAFTAQLDERRPDEVLRWHAVDGPACREAITVQPLSPRRSLVTIAVSGAPEVLAEIAPDLRAFKCWVERDPAPAGHFTNERPAAPCRHRSNWRDSLVASPPPPGEKH